MTLHDEVVAGVGELADRVGVLWVYQPRSSRITGHRGVPDLLLAGPGGIAFAEIKTGGNVLDPAQVVWRDMLIAGNVPWHLWWPVSLWDGTVEAELRRLAIPRPQRLSARRKPAAGRRDHPCPKPTSVLTAHSRFRTRRAP